MTRGIYPTVTLTSSAPGSSIFKNSTGSVITFLVSGIDFARNHLKGFSARRFRELLMSSGVVLIGSLYWVTFHSGYDFGCLLKLLTRRKFPDTQAGFFDLIAIYFPVLYDFKHLMKFSNLHGGLNKLGQVGGGERVGMIHQVGWDGLSYSS